MQNSLVYLKGSGVLYSETWKICKLQVIIWMAFYIHPDFILNIHMLNSLLLYYQLLTR